MMRHLLFPVFFSSTIFLLSSCGDENRETKHNNQTSPGDSTPPSTNSPVERVVSRELAPRSSSDSVKTMFERLPVNETGVDFINEIIEDHPMKYLYATEKVCGGVAVGDLDGNGLPDLFFTNGPKQNRLFLQMETMKFVDHTESAGLVVGDTWSAGCAMVDIDSDGDLDLYVANYATPNQLFVNDGKGVFEERAGDFGLDHVSASHMPTFCDYDKDGDLDLYLLVNRFHSPVGQPKSEDVLRFKVENGRGTISFSDPQLANYFRPYQAGREADGRPIFKIQKVGQPDVLFRNDGGKFVDASEESGIYGTGFGLSATWWDYNQDGWIDLWVGNDFDDPDRVYRNNGDGTFTDVVKEIVPHITWFSMGADFADLNGDQKPDFLIADMSGTNHFKQKTNMGSMGAKADFLKNADPQQYMRNALFLGTGKEHLLEAAHMTGLANSDWTWTVKLSDFDCDGLPDVFMTNGMSKNFNESDNAAVLARAGETEWDRHVRAGTKELREQNLAFQNHGDLKFSNVSKDWGLDHVGMSFGTAHADLDGDGDLDMVVCNLGEPASIYRNNVPTGNRLVVALRGPEGNHFGIGTKARLVLSDGSILQRRMIPVRGYLASNEPVMHFGLGDRKPVKLILDWSDGSREEVGDLKANHHYTISWTGTGVPESPDEEETTPMFVRSESLGDARHAEVEFDDFARQPLLPNKLSQLGPGQAWGDLDGDGDPDLWLGGAAGEPGQIWINEGKGNFSKSEVPALAEHAACEDMGGLWFDADGNGTMDLYVVSGSSEFEPEDARLADRLYLNEGGMLQASSDSLPALRSSGSVVCGADFDRDGDLDLFVGGRQVPGAYPEAASSSLLINSEGKFTRGQLEVGGLVTSALWSDVNSDGWVDLVVVGEWEPLRVFMNENGNLTEKTASTGVANLTGWWNGMAAADFDHDGDLDFAVTNFGLNTKYHASEEHPALVYYGDFEGLGRNRIVEAEFEDEILYPGRGRSCSSNAMPHLRKSITSFRQFAKSTLTEIYQPNRLKGALKLSATVLESGIFLNETEKGGAPRFQFKPLPRIAQIAPSFGVVADDVNHDGKIDLYLAQNFHSPQVETGRMSGGLSQLLLGKGDGTFDPVPVDRSGLEVPGDAVSLTVIDLNQDGMNDFVVARNDGPVIAFENANDSGKSLTVRIQGPTGNSKAIGARIGVSLESGRTLTRELHAGGGYLSQSPVDSRYAIPAGDSVSKVTVIWPDGNEKTIPLSAGQDLVEIVHERE